MKIRVGVFFGGQSCEHEVSCISANQALHALDADKYEVIPVYIAKNRDFYSGPELFDLANYGDLNQLTAKLQKVSFYKDGEHVYMRPVKESFFKHTQQEIDVAFLVMHGTGGEDGTLQGYVEMLGLPYTSSNVLGSAIGQDKEIMKEVLAFNKLPIIPWFAINMKEFEEDPAPYQMKADELGYPLILKPANLGSSIGITFAENADEFLEKVREAGKFDFKVVVEKKLEGFREVNCSVMGSIGEGTPSEVEEVTREGFLGFGEKYLGGGKAKGAKVPAKAPAKASKGMASTARKVPAELKEGQTEAVKKLAVATFKALNAQGVVRIDFMIDKDDRIYVNEINSIPGSLAFYLWEAAGMNFSEECDKLIDLAIKRQRDKEKKVFSFESNILQNYGRK
ncbi:MAG: D-alanine--D-alanine ligase [Erysipelotrichaceae bacterium]|nr:D-alanine--D-alanine ligase [Erysipelotrichaceae bacterium]